MSRFPKGAGRIRPIGFGARNTNLDLVRGVAVLGILVMNAVSYGLGPGPYFNLSAGGSETWLDWLIGGFGEIFVDQKFMGLFSVLFGAGIALFCDRAAQKNAATGFAQPVTQPPVVGDRPSALHDLGGGHFDWVRAGLPAHHPFA